MTDITAGAAPVDIPHLQALTMRDPVIEREVPRVRVIELARHDGFGNELVALIIAHLQKYRVYPDSARSAGITGVATVRFTLGASGNVIGVALAGSSGKPVLDQAALAMVQRASPFPPIPSSLGVGSMSFAAPVRFNIR